MIKKDRTIDTKKLSLNKTVRAKPQKASKVSAKTKAEYTAIIMKITVLINLFLILNIGDIIKQSNPPATADSKKAKKSLIVSIKGKVIINCPITKSAERATVCE